MTFDPALAAAHALPRDTPQQPLTLVTVGGCSGCPHLEVVGCGAGDGVDQSLQGLLIHVTLLQYGTRKRIVMLFVCRKFSCLLFDCIFLEMMTYTQNYTQTQSTHQFLIV